VHLHEEQEEEHIQKSKKKRNRKQSGRSLPQDTRAVSRLRVLQLPLFIFDLINTFEIHLGAGLWVDRFASLRDSVHLQPAPPPNTGPHTRPQDTPRRTHTMYMSTAMMRDILDSFPDIPVLDVD
jgi:hypothetical protein